MKFNLIKTVCVITFLSAAFTSIAAEPVASNTNDFERDTVRKYTEIYFAKDEFYCMKCDGETCIVIPCPK